jgi:ATP-binding cassette subfamily B (MDR/TAP) protein 6
MHVLALPLFSCLVLPSSFFCVQSAEYRFLSSLNVLNVVQSGIMFAGISLGVIACTAGVAKVSSTVLFK